eukprot:4112522-Pleurochrysis_carterae.AAC.3
MKRGRTTRETWTRTRRQWGSPRGEGGDSERTRDLRLRWEGSGRGWRKRADTQKELAAFIFGASRSHCLS